MCWEGEWSERGGNFKQSQQPGEGNKSQRVPTCTEKGPELGVHGALAGWNKKWATKRKLVLKGPKCCSITLGLCPADHKEPWVGRGQLSRAVAGCVFQRDSSWSASDPEPGLQSELHKYPGI